MIYFIFGLGIAARRIRRQVEGPSLAARSRTLQARIESGYRRFSYEIRHPENHKQLVRFLCVGASGYMINLVCFFILVHPFAATGEFAFVLAAVIAATNNFFWNHHWTFRATEKHPFREALRFFLVSLLVLVLAAFAYTLLLSAGIKQHTVADGIAWIIATPVSFVAQKLWSVGAPARSS